MRALEDLDPIPHGGDEYLTPLNMREAGTDLTPGPTPMTELVSTPAQLETQSLLRRLLDARQEPITVAPPSVSIGVTFPPQTIAIDNRQQHDLHAPPQPITLAAPAVQVDSPVTVNVEAAQPPDLTVNVEAPAAPTVQVDAPTTINVEAAQQQPAEVVIHNLQAPPVVEIRPDIHVEAAPAPDVVLQLGEQIHAPLPD